MIIRVCTAVVVAAGLGIGLAPIAAAAPYASCKAAAADGVYNIQKGDSNYSPKLDRDGDGVACERK